MKPVILLAIVSLIAGASAQLATPVPKKDPFTGFGDTSLDHKQPTKVPAGLPQTPTLLPSKPDKPGTPPAGLPQTPTLLPGKPGTPAPANPAASPAGLQLTPYWDSPTALSRGGPLEQRKELRALLTGFAEPGRDTSPHPDKRIYRQVTYLLPFVQAQARLSLQSNFKSGGKSPVVGFPDGGLTFESFTADAARKYEVRVLQDIANQVVAVEFVAADATLLPPPPDPLPADKVHNLRGKTYDFVPEGITGVSRTFPQVAWDVGDYVLISTRGGPKAADLYIPKPMVSFILYCLNRQPGH